MFTVEKNVQMPAVRANAIYPFGKLKVNESFFVQIEPYLEKRASSIRACASSFGKKHGMKFACRRVEGGIRIWRTA